MGEYKTVVIDLPWPIKLAEPPDSLQGAALTDRLEYSTMTEDEINAFDIDKYAAEKALLFMWATSGKLLSGIPVIEKACSLVRKWGFTFRTLLFWKKPTGFANFIPFRSEVEPLVFASRRVAEVPPFGKFSSLFKAPIGRHSEKPAHFYHMVNRIKQVMEKHYGRDSFSPAIDLFGRNAHRGFFGMGDEYVGRGTLAPFLEQTSEEGSTEA